MKYCNSRKLLRVFLFILGTLLLFFACLNYEESVFKVERSEDLVVGSMVYGAREGITAQYGLTTAREETLGDGYIFDVMMEYFDLQSVSYYPYTSQIGLQGHACRVLAHYLCAGRPVSAILTLRNLLCGVCCALMALVAMGNPMLPGKSIISSLLLLSFSRFYCLRGSRALRRTSIGWSLRGMFPCFSE